MRKAIMLLLLASIVSLAAVGPAFAQGGTAITRLRSFEEVPALASSGSGRFSATINEDGTEMAYRLTYDNMEGDVTQAHLHLAQRGVNGAIVIFLCSNLGNGPAGTQPCPTDNGTVTGTIRINDVVGAPAQGISPGELFSVLRGIRVGVVYANVHSTLFPGGEIRGQLQFTPAGGPASDLMEE